MHKDLSDLNKVWEIKPLKMAGESEARKILENVAKQVQPIMYKHKWKVLVLSEFCPPNPALMGLNIDGGAEIKIRLRRQERQWDFFTFEQILDTMLHELCHNEHGPHNADFYKLLDELRLECEELMAKGMTGAGRGFDRPGKRLGGLSQPPPLPFLSQHALAAAERRVQRGTLLPSGPRRLGGDNSIKAALSPNQAAAMAAERRLHDDMWCGSKSVGAGAGTQKKSDNALSSTSFRQRHDFSFPVNTSSPASSSPSWQTNEGTGTQETWQCDACTLINKTFALICEACETPRIEKVENFSLPVNHGSSSTSSRQPQDFSLPVNTSSPASSSPSWQSNENSRTQETWRCDACTLINKPFALICEACETPRIEKVEQQFGNWSCRFCTLMNSNGSEKCSACGEWRYSYGPPAAGYTPHVGT